MKIILAHLDDTVEERDVDAELIQDVGVIMVHVPFGNPRYYRFHGVEAGPRKFLGKPIFAEAKMMTLLS